MAKIAFVVGEDFEDSEFRQPYDALRSAGHQIEILGSKTGEIVKGKQGKEQVRSKQPPKTRTPRATMPS